MFTIWPGLAVAQKFGDHTLFIPANAVCDPRSSHYGPAHWDLPCTPSQAPIKVTATWKVAADGEPVVSFSPDLRFVPSRDRKRWVNLSLKSPRGIDPSADYAILWYDEAVGTWVDEALTDPSLRVRLQQSGNMVSRRLKHFSRYRLSYARSSYNVPSGHRGADVGGGW